MVLKGLKIRDGAEGVMDGKYEGINKEYKRKIMKERILDDK